MVESRQEIWFETMVKEYKLMTAIVLLPYFDPWELVKFCQLNKACFHIMQNVVNFQVLFEA